MALSKEYSTMAPRTSVLDEDEGQREEQALGIGVRTQRLSLLLARAWRVERSG